MGNDKMNQEKRKSLNEHSLFGVHPSARVHSTANLEDNVAVGAGSSIWDNVHIRGGTVIGENCIVGEKTYIAYNVVIGNGVKINSFVYICTGVTIEDKVMISAGTIFTNDRFPRAFDTDGSIRTSDPTSDTLETTVCKGATIGAGCIVGPGLELGEYCMVGMGSVVTRNVHAYELVYGNPARQKGYVCRCGEPLLEVASRLWADDGHLFCPKCRDRYEFVRVEGEYRIRPAA